MVQEALMQARGYQGERFRLEDHLEPVTVSVGTAAAAGSPGPLAGLVGHIPGVLGGPQAMQIDSLHL